MNVLRNFFCHLEHVYCALCSENFCQLVIWNDIALIFHVLALVFFDIDPQLFYDLCTRHGSWANNCLQIFADLYRLHKGCSFFLHHLRSPLKRCLLLAVVLLSLALFLSQSKF